MRLTPPHVNQPLPPEFAGRLGSIVHTQDEVVYPTAPLSIDHRLAADIRRLDGSFDDAVRAASALSELRPFGNEYGGGTAIAVLQALDGSRWIAPLNTSFTPESAFKYWDGDSDTIIREHPLLQAVVGIRGEFADLRTVAKVVRGHDRTTPRDALEA